MQAPNALQDDYATYNEGLNFQPKLVNDIEKLRSRPSGHANRRRISSELSRSKNLVDDQLNFVFEVDDRPTIPEQPTKEEEEAHFPEPVPELHGDETYDTETLTGKSVSNENINKFSEHISYPTIKRVKKIVNSPRNMLKRVKSNDSDKSGSTTSGASTKSNSRRRSLFQKLTISSGASKSSKSKSRQALNASKMSLQEYVAQSHVHQEDPNNNSALKQPVQNQVPPPVLAAIEELHARGTIANSPVYRTPGNKIKIQDLKDQLSADFSNIEHCRRVLGKVRDPNVITSFVKNFFTSCLSEPLLTYDRLNAIVNILSGTGGGSGSSTQQQKHQQILEVLESLPRCHLETLSLFMLHLKAVSRHFSSNQLHADSLNSALARSLVGFRMARPKAQELNAAKEYLGGVEFTCYLMS